MSKLFGTLQSEKTGKATRTASSIIEATAQSYDGSVSVSLNASGDLSIYIDEGWTQRPSKMMWSGKLSELLLAKGFARIY
jgi:hypothetical protein